MYHSPGLHHLFWASYHTRTHTRLRTHAYLHHAHTRAHAHRTAARTPRAHLHAHCAHALRARLHRTALPTFAAPLRALHAPLPATLHCTAAHHTDYLNMLCSPMQWVGAVDHTTATPGSGYKLLPSHCNLWTCHYSVGGICGWWVRVDQEPRPMRHAAPHTLLPPHFTRKKHFTSPCGAISEAPHAPHTPAAPPHTTARSLLTHCHCLQIRRSRLGGRQHDTGLVAGVAGRRQR